MIPNHDDSICYKPRSLPMKPLPWSEFKARIHELLPKSRSFSIKRPDGGGHVLFRGQANTEWKLESTLDRRGHRTMSVSTYMRNCVSARRFAGNYSPTEISFQENPSITYDALRGDFPNFEYMAYLRHHGFPSPLLDWTESPYIAAFFALREEPREGSKAARVYAFQADTGSGRGFCTSNPHILVLGPFATIHERHAIQQCWYTISVREIDRDVKFSSHEEAISESSAGGGTQDKVTEFDIDLADREEALADLYTMNITAFSLFRTVDALMETASYRLFK